MLKLPYLLAPLFALACFVGCIESPRLPKPSSNQSKVASPGENPNESIPPGGNGDNSQGSLPQVESTPFECEGANCDGEPWPQWDLVDFQPNSPRFEESYALEHFLGKTTVVVLLAGWCGYCRSQALYLQAMHLELQNEGFDVNVVVINKANAASENHQSALLYVLDDENRVQIDTNGDPIYRCTFPLFQDTEETNAWELHNGKKDDFYIYDEEGVLRTYLPKSQSAQFSTNLSTDEGFGNVKRAIIDVYRAESPSDQ